MSLLAKKIEPELLEAGTYPARCYSIIHIGKIKENFQGHEKELDKVRIGFELPTEMKQFREGDPEKPYSVHEEYTLSLHEKSHLRRLLESWRGAAFNEEELKGFDITKLLGQTGLISIIHTPAKNGRKYLKIAGISKMPKGMEVPPQVNPDHLLTYESFDLEVFKKVPLFVKDKMVRSAEMNELPDNVKEEVSKIVKEDTAKRRPSQVPYPAENINPEDIPF